MREVKAPPLSLTSDMRRNLGRGRIIYRPGSTQAIDAISIPLCKEETYIGTSVVSEDLAFTWLRECELQLLRRPIQGSRLLVVALYFACSCYILRTTQAFESGSDALPQKQYRAYQ